MISLCDKIIILCDLIYVLAIIYFIQALTIGIGQKSYDFWKFRALKSTLQ